ncbi:MAG: hypothetical protein ACKVQV_11175 [Bacteroidia bacterium]
MKQQFLFYLLLLSSHFCFAQAYKTEPVEWLTPKIYKAKSFTFKSDSVLFKAKNCKIFEIHTNSGVTGYYLEGDAVINIETKQLNEKCTAAMFRFNPIDKDSLITFENQKETHDDKYFNSTLNILKSTFRHCYHAGMDAIIPDQHDYAVDFFSPKLGEVLVSHDKKEIFYYNFTLRTKM